MVKLLKNKQEQLKIKDKKKKTTTEDNKKQLTNNIADDYDNELLISKERETFKNLYNERLD